MKASLSEPVLILHAGAITDANARRAVRIIEQNLEAFLEAWSDMHG